jgi:predicted deacetylase
LTRPGAIAVALHDIEPATFERCALIRDWLADFGIDRATLLVIPAADLHPFHERRPELAWWLEERVRAGDVIAQHGLQHAQLRRARGVRGALARWQGPGSAEFAGLDAHETRRAVRAGRRILALAGLRPRGFVAPAYAYTPSLREELRSGYEWWADLLCVHASRGGDAAVPALTLGTSTCVKRALSPALVRAGALLSGPVLRLDLHPADFRHPRHVWALEAVLRRARRRTAVTYDDLLAS